MPMKKNKKQMRNFQDNYLLTNKEFFYSNF